MKPENFEVYRALLKEKSGIIVTPDKSYLLESRLTPIAKAHDFDDLDAMGESLKSAPNPKVVDEIIEAMTTNETSFFRDKNPFDNFTNICLPYFLEARATQKKLRMWCAAASSGQEPYSIEMLLQERKADMAGWNWEMIATDLSNDILDQAKEGIYTQFEVQRGLPIQLLMKYFTQIEDRWQMNEDVRNAVQYSQLNLLDPYTQLGKFDIIFCRNVLIYFDEETKADMLERMAAQLEPDGYLFLGGAETVLGITDSFVPLPNVRGLYVMKDSAHLQATPEQQTLAS